MASSRVRQSPKLTSLRTWRVVAIVLVLLAGIVAAGEWGASPQGVKLPQTRRTSYYVLCAFTPTPQASVF